MWHSLSTVFVSTAKWNGVNTFVCNSPWHSGWWSRTASQIVHNRLEHSPKLNASCKCEYQTHLCTPCIHDRGLGTDWRRILRARGTSVNLLNDTQIKLFLYYMHVIQAWHRIMAVQITSQIRGSSCSGRCYERGKAVRLERPGTTRLTQHQIWQLDIWPPSPLNATVAQSSPVPTFNPSSHSIKLIHFPVHYMKQKKITIHFGV